MGSLTLTEALADPHRQERLVADCAQLVDREVASKGGLGGVALRASYSAFQRVRPGIVRAGLVRLLPEMVPILDQHWAKAQQSGDVQQYFQAHAPLIAEGLLGVTDRLASRATNRVLLKLYRSLRPSARDHVAAAVPSIPAVIQAHCTA